MSNSNKYEENHTHQESFLVSLHSSDGIVVNTDETFKSHLVFEFDPPIIQYSDKNIKIDCQVVQFSAFNTLYVTNSNNNFISIYSEETSTTITDTISVGNHNSDSLVTWFNDESIFGLQHNLVLSNDYLSQCFTITNANGANFIVNAESTCQTLLGFKIDESLESITGVLTFPYPGVLLGERNLYLSWTDNVSRNVSSSKMGVSSFIGLFPIDPLSPAIYYSGNDQSFQIFAPAVERLELTLTDAQNRLVDFRNSDWTLILKFNITKEVLKRKISYFEILQTAKTLADFIEEDV